MDKDKASYEKGDCEEVKMVYVYAKQSKINRYVGRELSLEDIEMTLKDLGMDIKGVSDEKDPELKIEITAEKLDFVSAVGISRAIKYYLGFEKKIPQYELLDGKFEVIVEESAKLSRPKTVAAIIRNVPMDENFLDEIIEIQEKIHESFARGRKKAAIGIYPLDMISFPVVYRSEKPEDIKFRPLLSDSEMNGKQIVETHETGKKFAHLLKDCSAYPVFRDSKGKVLSMPPIINSYDTGRVEIEHRDLFIECSGYNMQLLDNVLKVLVTTFADMGAQIEKVKVVYDDGDLYQLNLDAFVDKISLSYINSLIGIDINKNDAEKYLNKMMYGLKSVKGDILEIEVPVFKSDVWNDCDVADDIARGYGYNNIIPKFPNISSIGETLPFSKFRDRVSNSFTSQGFLETYTYMLTSTQIQFKKMGLGDEESAIKLIDSADQGINMIRTMILPESLQTLHINRKNKYPQKIFENGFVIVPDLKSETKAKDEAHLSVSIADPKSNYTLIKTYLDSFFSLNEIEFEVKESEKSFLIEGRRADVFVKGEYVGFIGEVHPKVLTNFGLIVPVSSFELNLEKIWELNNN